MDLEDGGLFFCQICHKDLSHMTPEGRTQHLNRSGDLYLYCRRLSDSLTETDWQQKNEILLLLVSMNSLCRCLDKSEESAPAPPTPLPGVPECPICGKKFKSQKTRSVHLKRCSSEMGISPAVLLQALQRQAEETQNVSTANTL